MDSWDAVGLASASLVISGVAAIYWPAAMILAGGFGLFAFYLRESALVSRPIDSRSDTAE